MQPLWVAATWTLNCLRKQNRWTTYLCNALDLAPTLSHTVNGTEQFFECEARGICTLQHIHFSSKRAFLSRKYKTKTSCLLIKVFHVFIFKRIVLLLHILMWYRGFIWSMCISLKYPSCPHWGIANKPTLVAVESVNSPPWKWMRGQSVVHQRSPSHCGDTSQGQDVHRMLFWGFLLPLLGIGAKFVYGSTNRLISNSISRKYKWPGTVPLTLHTNRGFGQMLLWQAKLIKKVYKTGNTIIQLLVSLKGVAQCVEGVAQCVW